jgi:copper chaperone CopZ
MKLVSAFAVVLSMSAFAMAETTVVIENTHMCCKSCVTGAEKAAKGVTGAKVTASQDQKNITVTAKDAKTAQAAVNALVAGGYFGTINGKDATIKNDAGAPSGKVTSLKLEGFHNCCKKCADGLAKAINSVEGAKTEVASKQPGITVSGNFDAQAVIAALNKAGYSAKVAK